MDSGIGDRRIEMRRLNHGYLAPDSQFGRGYISPVLSPVASHVNQSRIASRPDQIPIQRRWRNCEYDAVTSTFGVFESWRNASWQARQLLIDRPRQIGADGLPVQTSIDSGHYILGSEIEGRRITRRANQCGCPRITILALVDVDIKG